LAPEEANICLITLNRPDALNALSLELLTELDRLLEEIRQDDKIRVVVITGAGRAFSVGADLREAEVVFGPLPSPVEALRRAEEQA